MFARIFHLAIILLALAAVWLSIESSAQAGTCGDYLQSSQGDEAVEMGHHFGDRNQVPGPCRGPSCSRSSSEPLGLPVPKSFEPFGTRLSGLLTQARTDQDSLSSRRLEFASSSYSLHLAHEIFHPPRLG